MKTLVFLSVFVALFCVGAGLECYVCALCDTETNPVTCVGQCYHAFVDSIVDTFTYRGCMPTNTTSTCTAADLENELSAVIGLNYDHSCCSEDYCNTGTTPVATLISTITCLVVALLMA